MLNLVPLSNYTFDIADTFPYEIHCFTSLLSRPGSLGLGHNDCPNYRILDVQF